MGVTGLLGQTFIDLTSSLDGREENRRWIGEV